MKTAFFSAQPYEKPFYNSANQAAQHELLFFDESLTLDTVQLAQGCDVLCCFVLDDLSELVLKKCHEYGIKFIALRSAGFDHVDLKVADELNLVISRVPSYSPEAIAEFTVGLLLSLWRRIPQAYVRGQQHNFTLAGLMGRNVFGTTVGIIGTGEIGTAFAKIMQGFGCQLLGYDPTPNTTCQALGLDYVDLKTLLNQSDIVSLHCLLNKETQYIMNGDTFAEMKAGATLINTGRGGLVHTIALLHELKKSNLNFAGIDVYEKEKGIFFIDHKNKKINDAMFEELLALPNVLITPHQAFFTEEAVSNIANTTIENLTAFENKAPINVVN